VRFPWPASARRAVTATVIRTSKHLPPGEGPAVSGTGAPSPRERRRFRGIEDRPRAAGESRMQRRIAVTRECGPAIAHGSA
jgi:hypothetical protein